MFLKEISIDGLFGHFSHKIPLNTKENITIITGPNGYGKTVMLDLIKAIFSKNLYFIFKVELKNLKLTFDEFELLFDNQNADLLLIKQLRDLEVINTAQIEKLSSDKADWRRLRNIVDEVIPHLERVTPEKWIDRRTRRKLTLDEVVEEYQSDLWRYIGFSKSKLEPWLNELLDSIEVHIIKDQRLIQRKSIEGGAFGHRTPVDTIERYASELKEKLSELGLLYNRKAHEQDASLPKRWFEKSSDNLLNTKELNSKINEIKQVYDSLNQYGILKHIDLGTFDQTSTSIPDADRKFLTLYLQDHKEKLGIYSQVLEQIELFTEILNDKGLAFKNIKVDSELGFIFVDESGKTLGLTQLSSGEQHQVVLVYELIFNAKDNDLILIDEPEISLHIAWQKEFLNDVKRIIANKRVSVIIATHSPQIIDTHWDWAVDLE